MDSITFDCLRRRIYGKAKANNPTYRSPARQTNPIQKFLFSLSLCLERARTRRATVRDVDRIDRYSIRAIPWLF